MTVTATEFRTNLGKYIDMISKTGDEIIVTKKGKKVLQVSRPKPSGVERLAGLVKPSKHQWNYDSIKRDALEEKYDLDISCIG